MMKPALEIVSLAGAVTRCHGVTSTNLQQAGCASISPSWIVCGARLNVEIVDTLMKTRNLYPDVATLSMLLRLCLLSAKISLVP